jgi:hypothetical protein
MEGSGLTRKEKHNRVNRPSQILPYLGGDHMRGESAYGSMMEVGREFVVLVFESMSGGRRWA